MCIHSPPRGVWSASRNVVRLKPDTTCYTEREFALADVTSRSAATHEGALADVTQPFQRFIERGRTIGRARVPPRDEAVGADQHGTIVSDAVRGRESRRHVPEISGRLDAVPCDTHRMTQRASSHPL